MWSKSKDVVGGGGLKTQDMNLQHMKMKDQVAGHENDGPTSNWFV